MPRYRKIDVRIWNDSKFASLSNDAKLIFLFLLTSPFTQSIGAVPLDKNTVSRKLNLDSIRYGIGYSELETKGMIKYAEEGLYWIKNFYKYNPPENPKVVVSWTSLLDLLPECDLLCEIATAAVKSCESRGEAYLKALNKVFFELASKSSNTVSNTVSSTVSNTEPRPYAKSLNTDPDIYKEEIKKVEKKKEEKPENENQNFLFDEQNETEENENSSKPKKERKKAITFPLPYTEIPKHWVEMCHELTPDLDPFKTFTEFKLYWTVGKGAGKVTTERGWNQSWMNWLKIEAKKMTAPRYQHSGPIPPMPQRKYDQNGTLITTNKNGVRDSGFADPDYYKIKPKGY